MRFLLLLLFVLGAAAFQRHIAPRRSLARNRLRPVSVFKQKVPVEPSTPEVVVDDAVAEAEGEPVPKSLIVGGSVVFAGVAGGLVYGVLSAIAQREGVSLGEYMAHFEVKEALSAAVGVIEDAGPMGYLYFAIIYTLAELVAVPAVPLTASSGYLFGVVRGTSVVLFSATIAASISFLLARTFLRDYVQGFAEQNTKWRAIDRAVGKEGFKLVLLLRLSPLLPFALSNYLYGLSAVDFWGYFWGTFFGFMPGTIAYVYSGQVGREIAAAAEAGAGAAATGTPWYVYLGAFGGIAALIKIATGIAEEALAEEFTSEDAP